ncbi:MAG: nucleoside recognition protein [Legionellaceae bacterium]|nr:nucleoside recognition protein [Legionellaceae bacterium]
MLNAIWLTMMVTAVLVGIIEGKVAAVVKAATDYAQTGFEIALGLAAIMTLWLGIMAIARESGLIGAFSRVMRPVMTRLFPDVPADHPAMGAMLMNMAANMLGVGNAATPFGLKAMEELQTLNKVKDKASNAMCTFLVINTSSVQIIPITVINFLAINHATHPTQIIVSSLIATSVSTLVAIIAVKAFARLPRYQLDEESSHG